MRPDWIDLAGTANTRDVGGLPAAGGLRTQSRRLLRSDSLQELTAADVHRLVTDYGVRSVADLRAGIELTATGPGPLTREQVSALSPLVESSWSGRCTILYDADGEPSELYFWGISGD